MSNKIVFLTRVNNERQYEECVLYINSLEIPYGFQVETFGIRNAETFVDAYDEGCKLTDAKYKVYIHENTLIINKSFIKNIVDIFQHNESVGLIGITGMKKFMLSCEAVEQVGQVYDNHSGTMELVKYNNIIEEYEIVEAIDDFLMASQTDISWNDKIDKDDNFYNVSYCMKLKKKGFEIVVPCAEKPWCIHELITKNETDFEKNRSRFLEEASDPQISEKNTPKDLFNFNRERAMKTLVENKRGLENPFVWMKNSISYSDYESAARNAFDFASKASLYHPGFFVSPQVENMLLICGGSIPKREGNVTIKESGKRRVLHVLSEGYSTGGHTRLAKNWVKNDNDSIHSLVTTWQIKTTPVWLIDEIKNSGGFVCSLEDVSNKFMEKAAELRKLAYEWADVVVLHMHMMDPVPVMAFAIEGGPPVAYMNHGDHCFWLGASIADLIVDMRSSGQELTLKRRGVKNSYILPIPLQEKETLDKNKIREKYGIKSEELVILTIASHYKFRSINENYYIKIVEEIVSSVEQARVYVVGPSEAGKWQEAFESNAGRIKAVGLQTEIEDYYQLADIYLDCFMMGSMTSLIDASIRDIPAIKFTNSHCPILTEFDDEYKEASFSSISEIIEEIKNISLKDRRVMEKYNNINKSIKKRHLVDTQDKIKEIYSRLDKHKVNRSLMISNNTEDYDLFLSLLIKEGYVY